MLMKKILTPVQQERANRLARMTPAEWDAICKRCGICCLKKLSVDIEDVSAKATYIETVYLKRCCSNFNTKTKRCEIYSERLNAPNCRKVDMDVILEGKLLPASCGYVEYIFGPAPFPANIDFNTVRPIDNDKMPFMTPYDVEKEVIWPSVLWNLRQR